MTLLVRGSSIQNAIFTTCTAKSHLGSPLGAFFASHTCQEKDFPLRVAIFSLPPVSISFANEHPVISLARGPLISSTIHHLVRIIIVFFHCVHL